MPWAKFDDEYTRHPKLQRIPPQHRADAIALELAAICYSTRVLSDGFISSAVAETLGFEVGFCTERGVNRRRLRTVIGVLQDANRWVSVQGGWVIHDYLDYQPSAVDVSQKRRTEREKKRKQRDQGRLSLDLSPGDTHGDVPQGQEQLSPRDTSRARATGAGTRAHPDPTPSTPPQTPRSGGLTISKKELRRFTGCRSVRGSHGASYVHDPLGQDRPPADWPHGAPSEIEVLAAKAMTNGSLDHALEGLAQRFTDEQLEQAFDVWGLDPDERIRLTDLAADLRNAA